MRSIDSAFTGYEDSFPLFRGMLYMYEGYYSPHKKDQAVYQQRAADLLSNAGRLLADSFSSQAYQLLGYYSGAGRLSEWLPVDRIIRHSLNQEPGDSGYVIVHFAMNKVFDSAWAIARDWASYHLKLEPKAKDTSFESRFIQVAAKWVRLKGKFGLWKETPYYQRDEGVSFRPAFDELRRNLSGLRVDMVERNAYGSVSFNRNYRVLYYMMQWHLVMDLGTWAINDHREGVAILPLKLFLLQDVLPDELDAAAKAGTKPVLAEWQLRDSYILLTRLYINIGNGAEAFDAASEGIEKLSHYPAFTEKEQLDAFYSLYYLLPEAARTQGRYESALKTLSRLKGYYPQPSSVNQASIPYWNLFIDVRLQETFILKELNRNNDAIDSLDQLMAKLAPISSDSSELLYELYQWPHLQYAVMDITGKSLDADKMRSWLLEALTIVEQKNNWMNVDYYYPMQRLYLIAHYRSTGNLLKHVLYNLLFYTERNLRYSFAALSPEDRIRLYERKLSAFFDLYHELLFAGILDKEPGLKEKIIHQSLYLKNALADGNMIGTELFQADDEMKQLVEHIRRERSQTMLISSHYEMIGGEKDFSDLRGSSQSLWLSVLDYVNTDSLYESQGYKKISTALSPGQVYIETTRYTAWLSDSTARYAAYIISSPDKLQLVPLFREDSLVRILKDRSASPQSGLLNTAGTRGLNIKGKADSASSKFRKGDIDRLGAYIL
ncbi:MAG TPA: hypothetical protein VF145_09610, partial [Chitinophagaceae bacterium]